MLKRSTLSIVIFTIFVIIITSCIEPPDQFIAPTYNVNLNFPVTDTLLTIDDFLGDYSNFVASTDPEQLGLLYYTISNKIVPFYIEDNLKQIEKDAAKIPLIYKKRLMERISFLTSDTEGLDPVRIAQEAAIIADKSDVSEEIVRLYSHIKQFRQILDSDDSEGRKLNFLIQEFNREFNTIGSKAGNAFLSHMVVDLKSELEKIREQVQNIE